MSSFNRWDVSLPRHRLRGRSFILGNKRAFSLSLPARSGPSPSLLHPHKWFGAHLYDTKFLEGQVVRVAGGRVLGVRQQVGFTMRLTGARRDYELDGTPCGESFFVPDGIHGFACTLSGDVEFEIEPRFDLRLSRELCDTLQHYDVEALENGVVVSNVVAAGRFDDRTERFVPEEDGGEPSFLFAAAQVVGEESRAELIPPGRRVRRIHFRRDSRRQRFLRLSSAGGEVADHAPLWDRSSSSVYAPVRFRIRRHGTVVYGFGFTREEALEQLRLVRDNLLQLEAQKNEYMEELMANAFFETGSERVDVAYAQVFARLMDALVARNARAAESPLEVPATMILAGNQYFHDCWKRDENIALGSLLSLGFYSLAREVISDTWQLQDEATGRLPQRIRSGETTPYHSSDGTLWALWRLHQYWRFSGDQSLLHEKLPMVQRFFRRSLERAVGGMLPSGRATDHDYLWETWMDTHHTPRDGFPIEIQMLWLACLGCYRPVLREVDPDLEAAMARAESAAWEALARFNVRGMPVDSLDDQLQPRDFITPNPYFSFGVGLDLGPEVESVMRWMGRHQLAGREGILTLAPDDWHRVFPAEFLGDRRTVRGRRMRSMGKFNYHRGVEWNWLSQFFVRGELKYGEPTLAFRKYLQSQVSAVLDRGGIGGVSELHDLDGARGPDFQAWSMSGFLEALRAFAGIRVDVPDRRIVLEPQPPRDWPSMRARGWYGQVPFDLHFSGDNEGRTLQIEFPWGEVPDVRIEVALLLPSGRTVRSLHCEVDGEPQPVDWTIEPVIGSRRSRARLALPAGAHIRLALELRRGALPRGLRRAG